MTTFEPSQLLPDIKVWQPPRRKLLLTKGALSHQIRNLEQELGFPLFHRHSRGIVLSNRGREILATAEAAFEQIERQAAALKGGRSTDTDDWHDNLFCIPLAFFAADGLHPASP